MNVTEAQHRLPGEVRALARHSSPGTFLQETVFSGLKVTWLSLKVTRMSRVPQRHNTKERGSILLQFKEKYFKPIKCQANLGSLFSDRKCLSLGLLPEEATAFWRWGAWDPGSLNGFHRPWSQEMEESGCELHFVWLLRPVSKPPRLACSGSFLPTFPLTTGLFGVQKDCEHWH